MIDSTCRVLAQRMMHGSLCTHEQHLLDLHSKLVIVCMLGQTDLPCTTDVFEIALECMVDLFDRAQEVRIPLILQKIWTMVTVSISCSPGQQTVDVTDGTQPCTQTCTVTLPRVKLS